TVLSVLITHQCTRTWSRTTGGQRLTILTAMLPVMVRNMDLQPHCVICLRMSSTRRRHYKMLSDSENSPGQINILNITSRLMKLECSSADFFTFPERQFKLEIDHL